MRWEVQGAEAGTGKDVTLSVEAMTAEEAETQARYNGVLVSRVGKAGPRPAAPLDYAGRAPAPKARGVPEYAAIVRGAKVMAFFAKVVGVLGALAFCGAILVAALAIRKAAEGSLDASEKFGAVGVVAGCAFFGLGCLVVAVFLSMQASVGLAVRDMARNSFRG